MTKTGELEQLIRIAGAPRAALLHPRDLPAADLDTIPGVTDVLHALLRHAGLGDRHLSVVDQRTAGDASGASLTFGEVDEAGAIVVTIIELATAALTLDDLCATVADLRIETLVPGDDDSLDEVDCSTRAVYFGFGLLLVAQPENPDSDVTRDELQALLDRWHSFKPEDS